MSFAIWLEKIKDYIWGPPLLLFIGLVGLYLTFLLRGIQFRYLFDALQMAFFYKEKKSQSGDITHFQALMTSLAAAIGTGNIAGVATALASGGLGSIFWMWIIAFLGMAIKYSESLLAVKFRIKNAHGEMAGGPMYYLAYGAKVKFLATCFALFGIFATIGTGNMVQVNSVADALSDLLSINPWVTGIIVAIVTAAVLLGGVKSIGKVAEIFVPIMALFYFFGGFYIILYHIDKLPQVIVDIFQSAFTGQAAYGGFAGATVATAIQLGIARGIFSNEAGLGTSSIAAAAAKSDHPGRQALISMTSALLSTVVICTITALAIGVSGVFGEINPQTGKMINGAPMAIKAFGSVIMHGEYIVSIGLILFAYSTILGWAYYGEKCVEYLFGIEKVNLYRTVYIACIVLGAGLELQTVWTFADIMNGLMAIPNLLGLLLCHKVIREETKEFREIIKQEKEQALS